MSVADIVILIVLIVVVIAIVAFLVIRKIRGQGCLFCPHSDSCAACSKAHKKESQKEDEK